MCNFHQLYQIMKISIYQKKSYEKPIFHKKKCIFFLVSNSGQTWHATKSTVRKPYLFD